MKLKFTFDPELRETMEQVFENERKVCEKAGSGLRFRMFAGLIKRSLGMEIKPGVVWNFISDTEAEFEIITGMEGISGAKPTIRLFKEYEKISEGKIKVEEIK